MHWEKYWLEYSVTEVMNIGRMKHTDRKKAVDVIFH